MRKVIEIHVSDDGYKIIHFQNERIVDTARYRDKDFAVEAARWFLSGMTVEQALAEYKGLKMDSTSENEVTKEK